MDSRFASLSKNPRFLKPKKKDSKVSIDKRFSAIFNESNKEEGSGVKTAKTDKYGRKLKQSTASDLKRFYKLDEDVQEDVQEDVDVQEEVVKGASGDKVEKIEKGDSDQGDDDWQDDQDELDDEDKAEQARRLIRGEGLVESSDEEDEADDDVEVEMIAGEDEEEVEEEVLGPISKRFACVNMDWDNLKARDLYKVFDAFRPKQGVLKSVSIYKSEFGKERLEKEAREGPPKEIFGATLSAREEQQSMFGEEEGKDFDDEKLRKYQLDRLKYYYAVTVCDSPATANAIFTAVDGTEFEKSANVFNLQFIPDEMEFTDEPVDHATSVEGTYTPGNFSTAALQHSKAQLTWDLDDPDRVRVTRKKFTKEQLQDMDFKAYLASDTEEDSDDEEELKERMKKYKSLVSAPDDDEEGGGGGGASDGEVMGNMEITFTPGLSESAAAKMKKLSKEKEEAENDNVFLQERRKRKEKAKEKKLALKDDTFFNDNGDEDNDEDETPAPKPTSTSRKSAQAKKEKELAELELMMFDESAGTSTSGATGSHFDMKDVLKQEKLAAKKKKGKKGKKAAEAAAALSQVQDDFTIDVNDSRFAEMASSHHFAIDPTNPNFKKTAAMAKLLEARKKAPVEGSGVEKKPAPKPSVTREESNDNQDLMAMVNAIKRKSAATTALPQGKRNKLSK